MAELLTVEDAFGWGDNDYHSSSYRRRLPHECGYHVCPVYGEKRHIPIEEIKEWINENLKGYWAFYYFGSPRDGCSFCFKDRDDAVPFILAFGYGEY